MSVTDEEENGKRQGVDISPHYRRTVGLPMMKVMSPEAAEKEARRKSLGEGSLSLADLSKRVAEREEIEGRKSPEERRRDAQVEKMLSVGKDLCVKFGSNPQRSSLNWRQLRSKIKEFSDVKSEILSIAFSGLSKSFQKILSQEYAIGFFSARAKKVPAHSGVEAGKALKNLKLHIVCILAYKDDAKSKVGKYPEAAASGNNFPPQEAENLEKTGENPPPVPPEEIAQDVLENIPDDAETFQGETEVVKEEDVVASGPQDAPAHPECVKSIVSRIPPQRHPSGVFFQTTNPLNNNPEENTMDILPRITVLIGYSTAAKLRKKGVSDTQKLLGLSSHEFEELKLDVRTLRATLEKMLQAKPECYFSDGRDATVELLARHPLKKSSARAPSKAPPTSTAPPPDSSAANPASAVPDAADPPPPGTSVANPTPYSFEAAFRKFGAALDKFMEEGGKMDHFSLRSNIDVGNGTRFRIVVEQLNLPPAK